MAASFMDVSNAPWFKQRHNVGFVPRKVEDFRDGGAFPEIYVAQFPLNMGRVVLRGGSKIVRQNQIVYSHYKHLIPKVLLSVKENVGDDEEEEEEELQREIEETTQETKASLQKILNRRFTTARQRHSSKFIKYKPSLQSASAAFNSGAKERIINILEMPADPLDPPKFKHKRLPKPSASASPPVPIMHSPPRPVTVKDQQDWKIPPCISNWVNPKGYTIPLDKRLAADGRALHDVHINNNFATLSEALYLAEHKAREAVAIRSKLQKEILMKEKERKEHELRALAQKARSERTASAAAALDTSDMMRIHYEHASAYEKEDHLPKETMEEQRMLREKVREERRRERERERRLEDKDAAMGKTKKSKITRDRDRDISEKVALCTASSAGGAGRGGEVMYDQRLFNQDKGMDSGFATDDQYRVYDKALFTVQPTLSTLYRPNKSVDVETYGNAEQLRMTGPRDGPLEFEEDYFGLGQFSSEVNTGKKALKEVGAGGSMRASAGSSMRDGYEGGSSRTHIGFESGC